MRFAMTAALAMSLVMPFASTQGAAMPDDIAEKIRLFGPVVNPGEIAEIYAPLHEAEPYENVIVARDIRYGPDNRNRLDIFSPATAGRRPVLIFVHGGGFTTGDKHIPGSPFYDNVALASVRGGVVGVTMTYRLAPDHTWPRAAEDVAAAVRWVKDNIASHGGDPERIFLMGHSAGAAHVASYVSHAQFHAGGDTGLAGAIFVSGLFDLTSVPPGPAEMAYFGEDPSTYPERSSLPGLVDTRIPLMNVYAELDPSRFVQQAEQLDAALCASGRCPLTIKLARHSHLSQIYAINTQDTELMDAVLSFIASLE